MRILVTGATGQVGGALAARLAGVGTLLTPGRAALDLAKPSEIAAGLDRLAPELILNPAAYTAVDKAEDDRDLAFIINGESPGAIARWAAPRGVPLIHLSTDYVFDGIGTRPWEEDDVPKPLSVYGASKLAGEVAVRSAGGPHLVVRTSWVYAATGRNFLCTIARLAEERTELKIVADQIGAPTSAALIADAVTAILDGGLENLRCRSQQAEGLVNLAATGETSRHGFACSIVAGLRARGVPLAVEKILPIRTEEYPPPARRPRNSRLNLARLNHVFGLRPQSWEAVLAPELDGLSRASSTGAGS